MVGGLIVTAANNSRVRVRRFSGQFGNSWRLYLKSSDGKWHMVREFRQRLAALRFARGLRKEFLF